MSEGLEAAARAIVAAQICNPHYRGWSITQLNKAVEDLRGALGLGPTQIDPQTQTMLDRIGDGSAFRKMMEGIHADPTQPDAEALRAENVRLRSAADDASETLEWVMQAWFLGRDWSEEERKRAASALAALRAASGGEG